MDEKNDERYEPIKIEIEVGRGVNPMTITDGLIHYLAEEAYGNRFGVSVEKEVLMYEDIRMIGEALLSVYRSYQKREDLRERYYRV